MAKLEEIEGIGPAYAEKLRAAGVGSVEKLLEKGGIRKDRKVLADATGIDDTRLLCFVNHADLFWIKSIGGEYSELLDAAGVASVAELAQRKTENLHPKLVETNQKKSLVRVVAGRDKVADWIAHAKQLPKMVHH